MSKSNAFDNRTDTVETASNAASGMTQLLCKTLPINATVNSSTGNSNTDTTSGGLVQSPSSNPTATPGVTFDAAKIQKQLNICKQFSEKSIFARLAFENPLHIFKFCCIFADKFLKLYIEIKFE